MKEIQPQVKVEQHEVDPCRQEKIVSTMRLKRGLKLWKYHIATGNLDEVIIEKVAVIDSKEGKVTIVRKDKAVWENKCVYFQALNEKNAAKKVKGMLDDIGVEYKVIED